MTNSWPITSRSIFLGNAENQYGYFNYKKHITDAPLKIGSFNGRKIEINLGSTVNQAVRSATRSIKYAPAHFFDFNNLSSKRDLEIVESMYPKTTAKMIENGKRLGFNDSRSASRGTRAYRLSQKDQSDAGLGQS